MPLMGQHSQNTGGAPDVIAKLRSMTPQQLQAWVSGGSVDFGKGLVSSRDGKPERAAEVAAARAILAGDSQAFDAIAQNAQATHKDWTGGTLAKLAPALVGLVPGLGIPAALALGAGVGAATRATGLTKGTVLGGAVEGAALSGVGRVASGSDAPTAIGNFLTNPKNTPLVTGLAGTAANIYGAQQQGNVLDRQAELDQERQRRLLTPRPRFADWQAARRAPGSPVPAY